MCAVTIVGTILNNWNNLVPRALVTLVQRNVKRETLGQSVSDDKILVMQFNCAGVSILTKWRRNVEEVFHDGIEFSLTKLGNPNLDCREKRDVLTVLPTGFGKSLCYQVLPGILCRQREGEQKDSIVIVVSPLIALIRDQLQKLKDYVNVCVLQSIVEDEGESIRLTFRSHKMLTNAVCCLVIRRFL